MLLSEVVTTSAAVAATRSRRAKVTELTAALHAADGDELPVLIAYLAGEPRQDRLDLGPAAVRAIDVPAVTAPQLDLLEVDAALQTIADTPAGAGSRTARLDTLGELFGRATAEEQRWLRRLVLRELRQGSLAGVLTAAVAAAADVDQDAVRRAAMLSGSLAAAAVAALGGGTAALAAFRLRVGTAIEPMLAATATSVGAAVTDATPDDATSVAVEAKLDGARVQVHRDGDHVRVFTRNLREVTDQLPEVVTAARSLPATSVVLDGETLALDADGRPQAFQDTMSRVSTGRGSGGPATDGGAADAEAGDGDGDDAPPLTVRFFDVLHLDGRDVLDLPLSERLEVLARVVPGELRIEQLITDDVHAAEAFAARVLADGHEGVMVKALHAPYEAGRRGASWRKVKPVHTLDLVVLAVEPGSGRRQGWLSNLHLGARCEDGDPVDVVAEDGTGYVMLGKTFKGLTDEVLTWQTEALRSRGIDRPEGYAISDAQESWAVHVRPELVVEIAIDGFVRSTRYAGGLAMRFARVRGYRDDKAPYEADTLATARAIATGDRPPTG